MEGVVDLQPHNHDVCRKGKVGHLPSEVPSPYPLVWLFGCCLSWNGVPPKDYSPASVLSCTMAQKEIVQPGFYIPKITLELTESVHPLCLSPVWGVWALGLL